MEKGGHLALMIKINAGRESSRGCNCLDPGFVATNIGQRGASLPVRLLLKLIWSFGTSPEKGALTSIYLASSPEAEGVTGQYFAKSIPRRSASSSYDESLQRQLWEQSANW